MFTIAATCSSISSPSSAQPFSKESQKEDDQLAKRVRCGIVADLACGIVAALVVQMSFVGLLPIGVGIAFGVVSCVELGFGILIERYMDVVLAR